MSYIDQANVYGSDYTLRDAKVWANEAPEYDATQTYKVGDLCLYDGELMKCTTAIQSAEAWNSSHWTAATFGEEIDTLKEQTGSDIPVSTSDSTKIDSALSNLNDQIGDLNNLTSITTAQATSTTGQVIVSNVAKIGHIVVCAVLYRHGTGTSFNLQLPYKFKYTTYYFPMNALRTSSFTIASTANTIGLTIISGAPADGEDYAINFVYATDD